MHANKMLLHSYSAAFHAALLQVAKEICEHVRNAACVNVEIILQSYTKWKKKAQVGNYFVGEDFIKDDSCTKISFCFWCKNTTCVS